jgi:hypothetical protein
VHYDGGPAYCVSPGIIRAVVLPAFFASGQPTIISEPLSPSPVIVKANESNPLGEVITLTPGAASHAANGVVLPTSIKSLAHGAALSFSLGYTCSASAFAVGATVSQVVGPHRVQSESATPYIPCTGQPQTESIKLLGGPYAWRNGPAFVEAGTAWQTVPVSGR